MSRRSARARLIATMLAAVSAVALTACSATPSASSTGSPTPTAAATNAAPAPTPTPTFVATNYTCNSILPPPTLAVFQQKKTAGFALQTDYLHRMQNIGSDLVLFSTYGGILCQWSYPDSSSNVDYAFSPITDQEATSEQTAIKANGYAPTTADHGQLWKNPDTTDYPDEYLFIDGYWFHASTDAVLQLIVDNVFQEPVN
jgi:hypothetical protein